jgi:hypothetical protein
MRQKKLTHLEVFIAVIVMSVRQQVSHSETLKLGDRLSSTFRVRVNTNVALCCITARRQLQ